MSAIETPSRAGLPTGTWKVDPIHSKVGFAVKHLGVSTVRGEFRDFDGTLEVDEEGTARAYGTVMAASVTTNQDQRDEHLRSADFFEVDEHPELLFESTRIERADEDTFKVIGDLTLHGVTREIELDAEFGGAGSGPEGDERVGLDVTGQLSRKDHEMRFNAALIGGNAVVSDKVKLALDIEAIKQS